MESKPWVVLLVYGLLQVLIPSASSFNSTVASPPVRLTIYHRHVVLENGILHLKLTKPDGNVAGIRYNHVDNLLEHRFSDQKRGYWDISWDDPEGKRTGTNGWRIRGLKFEVVMENEEQVEVSFSRKWDNHMGRNIPPLNVDKRYVMLRGSSGFYAYAIYEHQDGFPDLNIYETRIALKLDKKR